MHRKYIFFILFPLGCLAFLVLVFGWRLQELKGDVTRVGGYSENDFGWNETQEIFIPPLVKEGTDTQAYDIVVLGDSFSLRTSPDRQTPYGGFWTDFLAQKIDASIGVFEVDPPKIEDFFKREIFLRHPPKLVVLEYVERQLLNKVALAGATCPTYQTTPQTKLDLPGQTKSINPTQVEREVKIGWRDKLPGETIDYLWKNLFRKLTKRNPSSIIKLPLLSGRLFTNKLSSEILLTEDDFLKKNWGLKDWQTIDCRLLQIQALAESNLFTHFAVMIAPDKSSAYSEYLPSEYQMPNSLEKLAQDPKLHFIRLDVALKNAIHKDIKDVYLPNDTHWGSAGSSIAAKEVVEYLKRNTPSALH